MATPALISDKFRIYNAEQFLSALGDDYYDTEGNFVTSTGVERSNMYFFVGRPQDWEAYLEIYAVDGTFQVGETVSVGAAFSGVVTQVFENSLRLTGITGTSGVTSRPTTGSLLTGVTSTAEARTGLYRYATEDSVPPALDNEAEFYEVYEDMISAKRMTIAYTRGVVRRYTWSLSSSETYDMYRPDYSESQPGLTGKSGSASAGAGNATSLGTSKFYVLNQKYECFKCIYNGSSGALPNGIAATRVPDRNPAVGQGVYRNPATTGDGFFVEDLQNTGTGDLVYAPGPAAGGGAGYVWKFMFKLPIDDVLRFLSTDFMPIPIANNPGGGSDRDQTIAVAVNGSIYAVLIERANTTLAAGVYFAPIIGDGTGGVVEITSSGTAITSVKIVAPGSGYTYASIPLENGVTYAGAPYGLYNTYAGGVFSSALTGLTPGLQGDLEPIISPRGGHGSNAEAEFNTKRVMANIRLSYAEGSGDFPVDNDFRRIGILKDPSSVANAGKATQETLNNLKALWVTLPGGDYIVDEEISQVRTDGGTAKGRVVSFTNNGNGTGIIKYYQSRHEHTDNGVVRAFQGGAVNNTTVFGAESLANGIMTTNTGAEPSELGGLTFADGLATSEFIKNTGDVLYLENRRLITRAPDQIEDIKLVIEF